MPTLPSLPIAGLVGLGAPEIVLIGTVILVPVMILAIVATAIYFKFKQRQAWQEVVRIALEKGQPVPPYPGMQWEQHVKSWQEFAMNAAAQKKLRRSRRFRDIRKGLTSLAFGAGVWFWAREGNEPSGWLILAYVPAFVGVALLLNGLLDAVFSRNADNSDAQPPSP